MVQVRSQNSNRSMVKQATENGQEISDNAAGITSMMPGVKNSTRGCGIVLSSTGRNRSSMAGHVQTGSS